MAMILDIADALVVLLNAETFTPTFTATRTYLPTFTMAELATLRVTVVPKSLAGERLSRAMLQYDYLIDIGIQKRVADETAMRLDPLMSMVEDLSDFCIGLDAGTTPAAKCLRVENEPIYSPEALKEQRVFLSILTLGFRAGRT